MSTIVVASEDDVENGSDAGSCSDAGSECLSTIVVAWPPLKCGDSD